MGAHHDGVSDHGPIAHDRSHQSDLRDEFWRDGAVVVRNAFTPDEIDLARRAIDANLGVTIRDIAASWIGNSQPTSSAKRLCERSWAIGP